MFWVSFVMTDTSLQPELKAICTLPGYSIDASTAPQSLSMLLLRRFTP